MVTVRGKSVLRPREARFECARKRIVTAVALSCIASGVLAATVEVAPAVRLSETYTDNVGASSGGGKESDWITEISPSLSVSRTGGRLKGNLTASAPIRAYANDSSRNSSSIRLAGRGDYTAIDDLLFVDFGASIQKEDTSILGGPVGDELLAGNQKLVRRYYLAPRLVFHLGHDIRGSAQYRKDWSSGGGAVLSGRNQGTLTVDLSNPVAYGPLGWSVSYSDTQVDGGRDTRAVEEQMLRGTLMYRLSPQLTLRGIAGHERNDYVTGNSVDRTFTGGGFDWSPTPRTQLSATMEDRFFGTGYNVVFKHARPLSNYELSYSRNVSSADSLSILSASDLFYPGIYASLEGSIPDPVERARQARALADTLAKDFPALGFVTNTEYLQTRLTIGVSFVGARNTLAFRVSRDQREALTPELALVASDTLSAYDRTTSKGASVSLVHKLTPRSSLNATFSLTNSKGDGASNVESRRRAFTVGYNKTLGELTSVSLVYRHQGSSGSLDYTENALIGSVTRRF